MGTPTLLAILMVVACQLHDASASRPRREPPNYPITSHYGSPQPVYLPQSHPLPKVIYGKPKPHVHQGPMTRAYKPRYPVKYAPPWSHSHVKSSYPPLKPNYNAKPHFHGPPSIYGSHQHKPPSSYEVPLNPSTASSNTHASAVVKPPPTLLNSYGAQKPIAYNHPSDSSDIAHHAGSIDNHNFNHGSASSLSQNYVQSTLNKPVKSLSYQLPSTSSYPTHPPHHSPHHHHHHHHRRPNYHRTPLDLAHASSNVNSLRSHPHKVHPSPHHHSFPHHKSPFPHPTAALHSHNPPALYPNNAPVYPHNAPAYPHNAPAYHHNAPAYPHNTPIYPHTAPTYSHNAPSHAHQSPTPQLQNFNPAPTFSYDTPFDSYHSASAPNQVRTPYQPQGNTYYNGPWANYQNSPGKSVNNMETYDTLSGSLREAYGNQENSQSTQKVESTIITSVGTTFQAPSQTFRFTPTQEQEESTRSRMKFPAEVQNNQYQVQTTEQRLPNYDQQVPVTEQRVPNYEYNVPNNQQNYDVRLPNTEKRVPSYADVQIKYSSSPSEALPPNYLENYKDPPYGEKISTKMPVKEAGDTEVKKKKRNRVRFEGENTEHKLISRNDESQESETNE